MEGEKKIWMSDNEPTLDDLSDNDNLWLELIATAAGDEEWGSNFWWYLEGILRHLGLNFLLPYNLKGIEALIGKLAEMGIATLDGKRPVCYWVQQEKDEEAEAERKPKAKKEDPYVKSYDVHIYYGDDDE